VVKDGRGLRRNCRGQSGERVVVMGPNSRWNEDWGV
jgi:hypothetical protein